MAPLLSWAIAAFVFGMSHANPNGPIGMACLLAAFVWLEFFPQSSLSMGEEESAPAPGPERPDEPEVDGGAEAKPRTRPHRRQRRRHGRS